MSNTFLTSQLITRETLRILENNLKAGVNVYKGYSQQFAQPGNKTGYTLNIRKPPRFIGRTGAAFTAEDMTDTFVPLTFTVAQSLGGCQFGVDFQFPSSDLTLSIDDFSSRYLKPAAAAIANKIDLDGLNLMANTTSNSVGVPGTPVNTLLTYLQATQKLDENAAPVDGDRCFIINPAGRVNIVDALKGLFQSSDKIAAQYNTGMMGKAIGCDWYMDQNVVSHVVGPLGGAPTVNTAPANGATQLNTTGWTAAAAVRLNVGDVFTIANVFGVNPQSRQPTGSLQQFVVTAQFSSSAAGSGLVTVSPAMNFSGQFQNINSQPAPGAVITVLGTAGTVSPQSMLFHATAFTLAFAELEVPGGVDMGYTETSKNSGVSLRFIRQYVASSDQWVNRFDCLYTWGALYPELACRIQS